MENFLNSLDRPSDWTTWQYDEVYQYKMCSSSYDYSTVVNLLDGVPKENLKSVHHVQCPYLYHRYMLRKQEYEVKSIVYNEMQLLHATDASNVESILNDNLDWRRVCRAKFGTGVSFSPSAAYANAECSRQNGYHRAIIVAKVLVGNTQKGYRGMDLPDDDCDTTTGNGDSVYVKYYDDEFYPQYVVYYYV